LGVRVESCLSQDSEVVIGAWYQLLYLFFDIINISYLLYFLELALLSAFIYFSEYEYLRAEVIPLVQFKSSFLFVRSLSCGFSRPD